MNTRPDLVVHDLLVVTAVVVGEHGREQFVVGAPDQSARYLCYPLEFGIGHYESARDVFGEDQRVGVVQYAVEHPPLPA